MLTIASTSEAFDGPDTLADGGRKLHIHDGTPTEGSRKTSSGLPQGRLRRLLERPIVHLPIKERRIEEVTAVAIREVVDAKGALRWFMQTFEELWAVVAAQQLTNIGVPGGIFANALFTAGHGEATLFIPFHGTVRARGRVRSCKVPAAEVTTLVHEGSHENIDLTYGALAAYVKEHALAVDGPLREYYVAGPPDVAEERKWLTEVCWPIFRTG